MKKTKSKSERLEAAVGEILDLRASRVRDLASKVARLKERLAALNSQKLKKPSEEIIR
jgi:hypothetical protein